ncbi:hypothetical protein BGX38DRAFT_674665 [Terfezia claveryi]|nr:hypothetical protein BGX38DRAFT_674665 [Terfezia claveryi]
MKRYVCINIRSDACPYLYVKYTTCPIVEGNPLTVCAKTSPFSLHRSSPTPVNSLTHNSTAQPSCPAHPITHASRTSSPPPTSSAPPPPLPLHTSFQHTTPRPTRETSQPPCLAAAAARSSAGTAREGGVKGHRQRLRRLLRLPLHKCQHRQWHHKYQHPYIPQTSVQESEKRKRITPSRRCLLRRGSGRPQVVEVVVEGRD